MSIPWYPDELSFIAEEEIKVTITPQFSANRIQFLSGEYGPFMAGRPIKVPMWLALFLHSSHSCTLSPPKWLNTDTLKKCLRKEKEQKGILSKLPRYYMEISFTFLNRASNTLKDSDQIKTLIEDIWDIRFEKLRKSIIEGSAETVDQTQLPNVTQMELHLFREPITKITSLLTGLNEKISINVEE
ncbi:DNA replication complex GINS protein PSF2 [Tritrichomonas foetus]|uniref:DNA replication complex GINS protein PSF2 n=1 Tax=Tritrichomonas foetus TaxID=1144522 RepID=A0A1J4L0L4_9EUKA|nr:DNA replication complex GINS protein PSF2 [Tritrichomonas foetus]|eukprot:OHT15510.1 DNA replication complex GINS protein PSF2 [Tritrichomonas foetus]